MNFEKKLRLAASRDAKIIISGRPQRDSNIVIMDLHFLIKESADGHFRDPIGENHPQFWKLKKSSPEKALLLQLVYSGISRRELRAAVTEFREKYGPDYHYIGPFDIEIRTKYLKGIRVRAVERHALAV